MTARQLPEPRVRNGRSEFEERVNGGEWFDGGGVNLVRTRRTGKVKG